MPQSGLNSLQLLLRGYTIHNKHDIIMFDYHRRSGNGTPAKAGPPANGHLTVEAHAAQDDGQAGPSGRPPALSMRASGGGGGGTHKRLHAGACFLIGVAGGTASGKTTVCDQIMQRLHDSCVVMLSQDRCVWGVGLLRAGDGMLLTLCGVGCL